MIKILIELLYTTSNIFNLGYYLKTIVFLINEFIPNEMHRSEYKLKLFETIADNLAKTESLKCLHNVFVNHLINCTDRSNKEELVKLIEYIAKGEMDSQKGFSKRNSGTLNINNEFTVDDLQKIPKNLGEKITKVFEI